MPINGKVHVGERLHDWCDKPGVERIVVAVVSGKLPTPIDLSSPFRGSSAEACALYGGASQWKSEEPKP